MLLLSSISLISGFIVLILILQLKKSHQKGIDTLNNRINQLQSSVEQVISETKNKSLQQEVKLKEALEISYQRYLPKSVLDKIKSSKKEPQSGG
ncbi:MAG: hypothetical protein MI810_22295 [Flavobacteriales bacterium]|jgi:uncharacterized protein YoxC|nr:hypothetical protein [Flavobacteriales bacterium]